MPRTAAARVHQDLNESEYLRCHWQDADPISGPCRLCDIQLGDNLDCQEQRGCFNLTFLITACPDCLGSPMTA